MCFYRKTRCGGGIGSLNFCREQQAVDPRGSERRMNKHPTVVPASRHTVVLPVWERGSMWYVVTSHTQTLKALKCVKSCLQARLVKTVNIRKPYARVCGQDRRFNQWVTIVSDRYRLGHRSVVP